MKKIPCEVYSRVVGYFRPVSQWNKGKQEEFNERKEFMLLKPWERAKKKEEEKSHGCSV
jgi:hypothetical protein